MNHTHSVKALYHTDNKQAFTNIEIIEEAIHKNKQIEFVYNTYGTEKRCILEEKKSMLSVRIELL